MSGQLDRVDAAVLPVGWSTRGKLSTEVAGCWSPTLSPDGRHAAYVSDRGGSPKVWVQPVGSELTFLVDTGEEPVLAVDWSTGGGWLAVQIAPGGAPRHELWLVRPDGSALHQVAGFGADTADNVRWLPGRSLLTVTENLTTTYVVDVEHGTRDVVTTGDLTALLDLTPARDKALLRLGPRGARSIVVRDLASGVDEHVTSGEQACFGPDQTTVYARSDAGEYPVLIKVGDGPAEVIAASETAEVESFAQAPAGNQIAVLWNRHGGLSELVILTPIGARVVEPLPGGVISGLSWSSDGSTLAFTAEGPGQPHGVWTLDDAGMHVVSGGPADPQAFLPTLETFPAHDGLELTGWLFRPRTPGPHPTVLWFHGGPEAQERPGHGPLFQSLCAHGIAVFAPNVRGSSGFGRTFVNADNGAKRYDAIADVAACVAHLRAAGVAGRVGIMGRSYGGYLTLAALVTYPDLFDVGVDVCGMSDFATFYAHTEPWIAAAAVSKYGDPVADAELLRDLSPMTHVDRLRTPLLVVHGENDTNVPVIEATQLVAALAERGVEHRYLAFPGEGHELLHRSARHEYLRATVDWLVAHLGA